MNSSLRGIFRFGRFGGFVFAGVVAIVGLGGLLAAPAHGDAFSFSTGNPDGKMASGARIPGIGTLGIETADDFILTSPTRLDSATFTGLLPPGTDAANVVNVNVDIYRVFPKDSTNPPSGKVPTRTNSPSDTELVGRSVLGGDLSFATAVLNPNFSVNNTVVNGINPAPNQTTGGEGPASGSEVRFDVTFTTPITLPADHYFFVPTVELNPSSPAFLWLSAPKPIVAPGTSFSPDLQAWIRNENLDPDWLRIGTDIVGGAPAPTFNATFSLAGGTVPEPSSVMLLAGGAILLCRRGVWRVRPTV